MSKKKILTNALANRGGVVVSESVDFDGTNDYLSRASDLVGNADGKTFTFSGYIYSETGVDTSVMYNASNGATSRFQVHYTGSGTVQIVGYNAAGSIILNGTTGVLPKQTFLQVIASVDLANASNRSVYINDEAVSVTWSTYTNDSIEFTKVNHGIGGRVGAVLSKCRISHVFLDYTYRDLSIEANRRMFTTIDPDKGLIPASGQAALNPILYLPMTDPDTVAINEGTGGDFTLNGVVARSSRGPNQYNAVASEFDGAADEVYKDAIVSTIGNKVTISFHLKLTTDATPRIFYIYKGAERGFVSINTGGKLRVVLRNSSGTDLLDVVETAGSFFSGANHFVSMSFDLSNSANRYIVVNGVDETAGFSFSVYTDGTPDLNGANVALASNTFTSYSPEVIGDFFLAEEYIDLATNNPFYDINTNKPKYLGESGELPTGSAPLIYLPLRADDAGKNLGTGGDFTVNSGPFVGARGASEFWARSAKFDGATGYLSRGALTGLTTSQTASIVVSFKSPAIGNQQFMLVLDDISTGAKFVVRLQTSTFRVFGYNAAGTEILKVEGNGLSNNTWYTAIVSMDLSNAANRHYQVNTDQTAFWSTYNTAESIAFSDVDSSLIGLDDAASFFYPDNIGFMYFTTDYIDFSQEANRLKFVSGLGYPVDLQPAIDAGDIPTPLIYMKFDDPSALGFNSGTGGDFTVNGTVTAGADVKG